jgi:hypothetical protein
MGGRDQQAAGEHQRIVGVDRRVKHEMRASLGDYNLRSFPDDVTDENFYSNTGRLWLRP